MIAALARRLLRDLPMRRRADFVIAGPKGDVEGDYLRRWYVIPRNPFFNLYFHEILRSDDDRALHDHPWLNLSILLYGGYVEHMIDAGGVHRRRERRQGAVVLRRARTAHRLELINGPCVTLFVTGPKIREWGFHCPFAGWRHWRDYTHVGEGGSSIGRGCDA